MFNSIDRLIAEVVAAIILRHDEKGLPKVQEIAL